VLLFLNRHPQRWPLTLALLAPSLVYLVTHVNVRYRYSSLWLMALIGGYAITSLLARIRPSATRQSLDNTTQSATISANAA